MRNTSVGRGEQQRLHQPPGGRHQPRADRDSRRRIELDERVAQPPRQDPVRGDLIADYHPWPGKTLVWRGPQRLACRGEVNHPHARRAGRDRRATERVGRKAHDLDRRQLRDLAKHPRDSVVQGFLRAIPVGHQRLYVEDHRPGRQFPDLAGRVTKAGRMLENGSHIATSAGAGRPPARCRSLAQFTGGFGAGTPGRTRGTQTRSAPGETVQVTGVDISIDSPSTPTGICGASAVTSICFVVSTLTPAARLPRSRSTACPAVRTVTPTTPSTPPSSRARRLRPATSPVPYGLLATSSACGATIRMPSACAASLAPR